MSAYFVYIARCNDASLYTGWTNNLEKRLAQHNEGTGAKYTRARRPVTLVYSEICASKVAAMQREYAIKALSHQAKLALLAGATN